MRPIDPPASKSMSHLSYHDLMHLMVKIGSNNVGANMLVAYFDRFFNIRLGTLYYYPVIDQLDTCIILKLRLMDGRHQDARVLVNWDGTPIDMAADSPVYMRSYFRDPNDSSGCQRLKIRSWHYLDELDSKYIRELGERYKDKIDIPFYGIYKGAGDETPGGKSDLAMHPE